MLKAIARILNNLGAKEAIVYVDNGVPRIYALNNDHTALMVVYDHSGEVVRTDSSAGHCVIDAELLWSHMRKTGARARARILCIGGKAFLELRDGRYEVGEWRPGRPTIQLPRLQYPVAISIDKLSTFKRFLSTISTLLVGTNGSTPVIGFIHSSLRGRYYGFRPGELAFMFSQDGSWRPVATSAYPGHVAATLPIEILRGKRCTTRIYLPETTSAPLMVSHICGQNISIYIAPMLIGENAEETERLLKEFIENPVHEWIEGDKTYTAVPPTLVKLMKILWDTTDAYIVTDRDIIVGSMCGNEALFIVRLPALGTSSHGESKHRVYKIIPVNPSAIEVAGYVNTTIGVIKTRDDTVYAWDVEAGEKADEIEIDAANSILEQIEAARAAAIPVGGLDAATAREILRATGRYMDTCDYIIVNSRGEVFKKTTLGIEKIADMGVRLPEPHMYLALTPLALRMLIESGASKAELKIRAENNNIMTVVDSDIVTIIVHNPALREDERAELGIAKPAERPQVRPPAPQEKPSMPQPGPPAEKQEETAKSREKQIEQVLEKMPSIQDYLLEQKFRAILIASNVPPTCYMDKAREIIAKTKGRPLEERQELIEKAAATIINEPKELWRHFTRILNKFGIDPEDYRELFNEVVENTWCQPFENRLYQIDELAQKIIERPMPAPLPKTAPPPTTQAPTIRPPTQAKTAREEAIVLAAELGTDIAGRPACQPAGYAKSMIHAVAQDTLANLFSMNPETRIEHGYTDDILAIAADIIEMNRGGGNSPTQREIIEKLVEYMKIHIECEMRIAPTALRERYKEAITGRHYWNIVLKKYGLQNKWSI